MIAPNVCELSVRIDRNRAEAMWEEGDFTFIRFPKVRGMREFHPFSIVNAPDGTGLVKFAIRGDGDFTRRLPFVAVVGERVDLLPPFGRYRRFLDERGEDRPIVMVAGGIGVTPLLPIMFSHGRRRDIVVMYSARDIDGLPYRTELETWRRETGNTLILGTGPLRTDEVHRLVVPDAVYLIAGPSGMTRIVRHTLRGAGVEMDDICYEPFAF